MPVDQRDGQGVPDLLGGHGQHPDPGQADEPAAQIQLAGWWQKINEGNPSAEPTLQKIVQTFGFSTVIAGSGLLIALHERRRLVARVPELSTVE